MTQGAGTWTLCWWFNGYVFLYTCNNRIILNTHCFYDPTL